MINVRRIRRECRKADGYCDRCLYGYSLGGIYICGVKSKLITGGETRLPKDWDIARTEKFVKERNKEGDKMRADGEVGQHICDWVDRVKEAHWYTEDPLISMKYTSIKENKKHE